MKDAPSMSQIGLKKHWDEHKREAQSAVDALVRSRFSSWHPTVLRHCDRCKHEAAELFDVPIADESGEVDCLCLPCTAQVIFPQEDLPPEFRKVIDDNFWALV